MGRLILTLSLAFGFVARAHAAPEAPAQPQIDGEPRQDELPSVIVIPQPFGASRDPNAADETTAADSGPDASAFVFGEATLVVPEQVTPPPGYPLSAARTRLAVIQGLNGAALGAEMCALVAPSTDERRCTPLPFVLGAAAALTAGLTVRPGITSDHVTSINAGTVLGAWHGTMLLGMSGLLWRPVGADRQVGAISMMAGSQIIGTLAGHFVYQAHPAREGVVDAASVMSLWGGLSTSMLIAGYANPTDVRAPHARQFGSMMLGTEIGLGLGILVGRHTHFTPFRALMVHSYALGGGLAGIVVGLPIAYRHRDGSSVNENDFWRAMGYGTLLGTVVGVAATQNLGSRGMVGPAFSFDVHPVTHVVVSHDGETTTHSGAIATVAGRF